MIKLTEVIKTQDGEKDQAIYVPTSIVIREASDGGSLIYPIGHPMHYYVKESPVEVAALVGEEEKRKES